MIKVYIYTDGSCIKNPGPGGCAAIVKYNNKQYIFKAGYYYTTNNRMELMAFILPMRSFLYNNYYKIIYIYIFTDSNYLYKGINEWLVKWKNNNWKNSKNKLIKNIDLWIEINYLIFIFNNIKISYIKGHNGNIYNEKCDKIAFLQAKNPFLYDLNPPNI